MKFYKKSFKMQIFNFNKEIKRYKNIMRNSQMKFKH